MNDDVRIRDVMTHEYVGVSESDAVRDVVQLMRDERVGSVVVLRGQEPAGILTEWDVLGLVADGKDPNETLVSAVMTAPVLSMEATRSLSDAAARMSNENIRRMVAIDESGEIAGVLTERDIISASASLGSAPRSDPETRAVELSVESTASGNSQDVGYSSQSICENCGSLSQELTEFNGQLICVDCLDM